MKNLNLLQKKWYVVDSQATKNKYKQNSSIKCETESIKSSLCDYSHAFILVTGNITVNRVNDTDVEFENCAPFSMWKTKINDVFTDEANQIIFTLQCLCTIWMNIMIIIQIHHEGYGSLKEMKFQIIMLTWLMIILSHLNMKQLL